MMFSVIENQMTATFFSVAGLFSIVAFGLAYTWNSFLLLFSSSFWSFQSRWKGRLLLHYFKFQNFKKVLERTKTERLSFYRCGNSRNGQFINPIFDRWSSNCFRFFNYCTNSLKTIAEIIVNSGVFLAFSETSWHPTTYKDIGQNG